VTVEVRTITEPARLAGLEPEWRSLARATGPLSVFQHPAWMLAWWAAFGTDTDLRVHAAFREGRLVGLAPVAVTAQDGPDRVAVFMGAPFNDFNDFLVTPDDPGPVVTALWHMIIEDDRSWTEFQLGPIRPDAALRADGRLHSSPMVAIERGVPQPAPALAMDAGWESYRLGLDRRHRRAWERSLERALAAHVVAVETIDDPGALHEAVERFEALRQASWAARGRVGDLVAGQRDPRFPSFLAAACARLAADGRCLLLDLRLDGELVAADLYLIQDQYALLYLRMFRPHASLTSPGMALALLGLRLLHARGVRAVSLGRGAESYKYRLGGRDILLERPILRRAAA